MAGGGFSMSCGTARLAVCATLLVVSTLIPVLAEDISGERVGVIFGSYGDVDKAEEVEGLVKNTIRDEDMLPLPWVMRQFIAYWRWYADGDDIKGEYAAIGGGTNMRARAQAQADAVAQRLRANGIDANGYIGFAFTFPSVAAGLEQAQHDDVQRLFVYYQGPQHSRVTSFIVFRDVQRYLIEHPEWDVRAVAIKSFAKDQRYIDMVADSITSRLATDFADEPGANVCIFLPVHGNILKWIRQGDPYLDQVMYDIEAIETRFSDHPVYHGFQNHDMYAMTEWTEPGLDDALATVSNDPCQNVIINGRLSFTVDNLETMFDHATESREVLLEGHAGGAPKKKVVAEKMFNSDPVFVNLMADLALEAMQQKGDILPIARSPVLQP
jgi:ferrochelatase